MTVPKEIEIQERIIKNLQNHEIFPFSVIFSFESSDNNGILSITFYFPGDLERLLDVLNYKNQCDKSGWTIIRKTNTILVTGLALLYIYSTL